MTGRYTNSLSTPELRQAIKKRNGLRRTITDNRAEYLEAFAATRKLSEEACQKKWEEFLADLENSRSPRPDLQVKNYEVAVWNPLLNNIYGAPATQVLNLHHQPRQSQRLQEGIRSSQPPMG